MRGAKKTARQPEKLGNGIYLYDVKYTNKPPILSLLARGMVVFLLVFGSVGGFLSAFDLSYNSVLFAGVILLSALFFSVIYIKPFVRNIGYLIFLLVFVAWAIRYKNYINSGFYALINEMTLTIADYFQQGGVKEYSEYMSNRYVTVTMMACFIGIVDALLMNISMLRKINLFQLLSMSLLVYFVPVYLEQEAGLGYVMWIMAGLGCAMIMKAGNRVKTFPQKKRLFQTKKAKPIHISYEQSPELWLQTIGIMVVMSAVAILGMTLVLPQKTFQQKFSASSIKVTMDAYMRDIWQFGLEGIFDRSASGGMGKGQIGRAASVRPDYETDLVIRFTPYSTKPLYLKAYTGIVYGDNQWESEAELLQVTDKENEEEIKFKSEAMQEEALVLKESWEKSDEHLAQGKLWIENVDADAEFLYYPYYTLMDDYRHYSKWKQGIRVGKSMEYTYYPMVSEQQLIAKRKMPEAIYLDVPKKNEKAVEDICKEMDLHGKQEEIIEQVVTYFEEHIPYTVRPGAVPGNEDVINYFLTKNRKGYCAHFASSAVLIFRHMGIPARYVEGYAVGYGQMLEGTVIEEDYEEYYQGYSALGKTAVMEVEVSDASAHAWVEVFDKEFGWIPVEVTPSSSEDLEEENNFWDFLRDLFEESEAVSPTQGEENHQEIVAVDIDAKRISIVLFIVIATVLLCYLLRVIIRIMRVRRLDVRSRVVREYERLCEMLRYLDDEFRGCNSHREQMMWMQEKFHLEEEIMFSMVSVMEEISYSKGEIEETTLIKVKEQVILIRKNIRKQLMFSKKWRLLLLSVKISL